MNATILAKHIYPSREQRISIIIAFFKLSVIIFRGIKDKAV